MKDDRFVLEAKRNEDVARKQTHKYGKNRCYVGDYFSLFLPVFFSGIDVNEVD